MITSFSLFYIFSFGNMKSTKDLNEYIAINSLHLTTSKSSSFDKIIIENRKSDMFKPIKRTYKQNTIFTNNITNRNIGSLKNTSYNNTNNNGLNSKKNINHTNNLSKINQDQSPLSKSLLDEENPNTLVDTIESLQYLEKHRKSRLITTMPSTTIKLTKFDIRRKLLQLKFPITILEKNELSSTIKLEDYEALQFKGLEDYIWPFMVDWTKKVKNQVKRKNNIKNNSSVQTRLNNNNNNIRNNYIHKKIHKLDFKTANNRIKHPNNVPKEQYDKCRIDLKTETLTKDKILNILYKKSTTAVVPKFCDNNIHYKKRKRFEESDKIIYGNKTDLNTDINLSGNNLYAPYKQLPNKTMKPNIKDISNSIKHIDDILVKIQNGVYYNISDGGVDIISRQLNNYNNNSIQDRTMTGKKNMFCQMFKY